jgi:hypothetical protein
VEFTKYLDEKYSELSFEVGFTKVDPIYGKFYTKATCLDDNTIFTISKSFRMKDISENYIGRKSQNQYNSKINEVFYGSGLENKIRSVTGSGNTTYENGSIYTQINIYLSNDVEPISVIKNILNVLRKNNISAEKIIWTYEKEKHVYAIELSSDEYYLTEKEIEAKVKKIK